MKELITVNMVRTAEKARLVPVTYREIADALNTQIEPQVMELVAALEKIATKHGYDGMPNDLARLNIDAAQAAIQRWEKRTK